MAQQDHGFAALADLDSNADGKLDASDSQYPNLKIWRDLNQDGISQAGELKTLLESQIQSISTASTAKNSLYPDAILIQSGCYKSTNGLNGEAGSFILAQNYFVRSFIPIPVSAAAQALPNIGGAGWVRDLQEAATQSPELVALFSHVKVAGAGPRVGYQAAVAALLLEWGNDSVYSSASKMAMADFIVNADAPYSVADYAICTGITARFKGQNRQCRRQKQHSRCCANRSTAKTPYAISARVAGHKRLGRLVDVEMTTATSC